MLRTGREERELALKRAHHSATHLPRCGRGMDPATFQLSPCRIWHFNSLFANQQLSITLKSCVEEDANMAANQARKYELLEDASGQKLQPFLVLRGAAHATAVLCMPCFLTLCGETSVSALQLNISNHFISVSGIKTSANRLQQTELGRLLGARRLL